MQSETETISARLKKAEVCAELGVSPRTLENLVKAKRFPPAVRVGRWSYWGRKALEDWHRRQFSIQDAWRPV